MVVREVPYDGYAPLYEKLREQKPYVAPSPSEVAGWDETRFSSVAPAPKKEKAAPKVKLSVSRIRVQLSRPLTWAEKEHLETNHDDADLRRINETTKSLGLTLRVEKTKREHVWVEAPFGSRIVFELLAAALESHFVNVFPKAVRTFHEYNGE